VVFFYRNRIYVLDEHYFGDHTISPQPKSMTKYRVVVNRFTALDLPSWRHVWCCRRHTSGRFHGTPIPRTRTHGVAERALDHREDGLRQRSLAV